MTYSFLKGLGKTAIAFLLFLLPFMLTQFPDIANLTIGAGLTLLLNFLKVRFAK